MEREPCILILEHDPLTRRLLTETLASSGVMTISEASHGPAGLARLQAQPPVDLVIVEPAHPSARGWLVIRDLRTQAPEVPILVLSTILNEESLARALELGADDYLFKPVDLGEFRKSVSRLVHLRNERLRARASGPGPQDENEAGPSQWVVRTQGQGMSVEVVAPTGSTHLDRFECFVQRILALHLNHEECLKLKLALEEMVSNANEWGNHGDRRKLVKLAYSLLSDRVTFRIEDQGQGFNPLAVPDPTPDPIAHVKRRLAGGKRIGGWGLLLTRHAVDEVSYSKKGNIVFLTKFLSRHS